MRNIKNLERKQGLITSIKIKETRQTSYVAIHDLTRGLFLLFWLDIYVRTYVVP